MKPYTFDAWDTVVRELQERIGKLAELRDSIGAIPTNDYDRLQRMRRLISALQEEWQA